MKRTILISPARGVNNNVLTQLLNAESLFHSDQMKITNTNDNILNKKTKYHDFRFKRIRELYQKFEYSDLALHPAIVILPYQVSYMSFFEYYRMCIPMFVPSVTLLVDWHLKYHILNERTWNSVFNKPKNQGSAIGKHVKSHSKLKTDPNDEINRNSLLGRYSFLLYLFNYDIVI